MGQQPGTANDTLDTSQPGTPLTGVARLSHMHTWMQILNPSTSAKPFMTKLQNLFVALVNMDVFHKTLKFSLFTID